jgi:hypothetical protein
MSTQRFSFKKISVQEWKSPEIQQKLAEYERQEFTWKILPTINFSECVNDQKLPLELTN